MSRTDWAKSFQHPLQPGLAAFMFQDDYPQFDGGRKHFIVAEDGRAPTLLEGDECGDWAAIQGKAGGLIVSCRDAARQHPKEFEASATKLNLKLFSSRAGEHLDFRPPALVNRWNKGGKIPPSLREEILKQPSNAVGWSKTHQLLLQPVPASATADEMARLSRLHSTPVLARTDPEWIHRSRVFGPLHPKIRCRSRINLPDGSPGPFTAFLNPKRAFEAAAGRKPLPAAICRDITSAGGRLWQRSFFH